MKKLILMIVGLAMACNSSQKTVDDTVKNAEATITPVTYAQTITEAELKEYLYTYASDEFEGRETGEPGQRKAAAYIEEQYKKMGISAAKANGEYLQKVPLEISKLPYGSITLNGTDYPIGDDFLSFTEASGAYTDIVYVGYGIEDGDYSDYKGLDVAGKLLLMKAGEPQDKEGTYILSEDGKKSIWSNVSESLGKRMELATAKGAKGVIYFDNANFKRFRSRFRYLKNNDNGSMGIKNEMGDGFLSFYINNDLAEKLLPGIANDNKPKTIAVSLTLNVQSSNRDVESENVVAIVRGSEKPNEYIIISSHLDHIGVTSGGQINNGADDDGSGTVALLEIAEAFKKAADEGNGPRRSVVFLHVTGEEKGLLGSQYYTDVEPIFPLAQTVANLNIDMIGRIDPKRDGGRNYVYLIGSDKLSMDLHKLSEEVNSKYTNIELDYTYNDEYDPNRFYYRSDHYNFAKNNIPIIFYFNGTHDDYHRPTDTPDKINYDLLQNRTRLIFHTAWEVANRGQRVVVDKTTK
ncbi:M28 family peptidase [Spongiimicrobium sp. 3-5]|uniref:M28 family peptidase n=1 Tax=Spongiimicrobium sp. 3-5 TaxID=3332596 RepID=UPI00397F7543